MLKNSLTRFGGITKILHWTIFMLFCFQYLLIWDRSFFPKDDPERTLLINTHRSIGVTILVLGICFLLWRAISPRPMLIPQPRWERILTKIVHDSLLTLLILMPVTGYCLSVAYGKTVSFFGFFNLPKLLPTHDSLGAFFDDVHVFFAYAIIVLVSLHVIGALRHHFLLKDNVLERMLPSKEKEEDV